MPAEKNKLIAWNDLESRIIEPGFCTLCGGCEATCPTHAIAIKNNRRDRILDCSEYMDLCPICYEMCPHSFHLLIRSLKPVQTAPIKSEALGYYRRVVIAQAADAKLREQSLGGAVVTSLLNYGVEKKVFDSAIVSRAEPENPALPKPLVALVRDDILAGIGSKFFPSSVANAYGSAVFEYGKSKIAFVGVPCQVLALRKIEAWQHKISGSLKTMIGLFCFGTFSSRSMLEHLEKTYKIKPLNIKRLRLSSKLIVETENGDIAIPISEIEDHLLPSCRTCMDFTAELADISVGAAHPLENWSTVIIRTEAGEDFFNDAVKNDVLKTRTVKDSTNVFERVVLAAMQKRGNAIKEFLKLEKTVGQLPVPIGLVRETDEFAYVKVEEIMTRDVITVPQNITVTQFLDLVAKHQHTGYPVINEKGEYIGWVTLEEASKIEKKERNETLICDITLPKLVAVHPGATALDAFRCLSENETGRLLVLDLADPKKILGVVTKTDLVHALTKQL